MTELTQPEDRFTYEADAVVLLSGGLDSTVLLAKCLADGMRCRALSVDYGSRHARREIEAAERVAWRYDVPHEVADLRRLTPLLAPNALTGAAEVPEGHYADDTMAATVVPGRNLLMLAVASSHAAAARAWTVVTAVHAGDHPVYPDCRPAFIRAAAQASLLGTLGCGDVTIHAPFEEMSKAEIVALGHDLDAPFDLTWSCYVGGDQHCGRCGTCVERAEAFHAAGVPDPTTYADPQFWRTQTRTTEGSPA